MIELAASIIIPLLTEDGEPPEEDDGWNLCIHGNYPDDCDFCKDDGIIDDL